MEPIVADGRRFVMEVKIVEVGVNIEICVIVNGLELFTHLALSNVEEAREYLHACGLKETQPACDGSC